MTPLRPLAPTFSLLLLLVVLAGCASGARGTAPGTTPETTPPAESAAAETAPAPTVNSETAAEKRAEQQVLAVERRSREAYRAGLKALGTGRLDDARESFDEALGLLYENRSGTADPRLQEVFAEIADAVQALELAERREEALREAEADRLAEIEARITPERAAEEAAVVDLISGGRLQLGLRAGYVIAAFEAYGADISKRYSATDACIRELRQLFSEGRLTPPPIQKPLPLWAGYMGPQGAKRAGKLGVGLLTLNRDSLAPYKEAIIEGGFDPLSAKMAGLLSMVVADEPALANERILPHLAHQLNSYRQAAARHHEFHNVLRKAASMSAAFGRKMRG